ncbi:MAG: fucose isomerase [Acidobacteria bacterium]|nr:fucose isomerase [Acidobacteriota bacterium]
MAQDIYLIANGDLRLSANQVCWPAQQEAERQLTAAIEKLGHKVVRGHELDAAKQHGFIDSQKRGLEVFESIPPKAPLIVCEAVWQYSQHVLPGLMTHQGPILTAANWSGQWPGLVGMLNLNGSLAKAGVAYSTIWSESFDDEYFLDKLGDWLSEGSIKHSEIHVKAANDVMVPHKSSLLAKDVVKTLVDKKAILGVFDEGCMGMYNAIIPDELLAKASVFKERLSQSALYAEMRATADAEAQAVRDWLDAKGMRFHTGSDEATELTDAQILQQCKMYIAALRIADDFGCAAIGIQYQQGLKDLCPASDLAEGLLNNVDRPPVTSRDGSRVLYEGQALPHFNEVDECAGLDALITNRLWTAMGFSPETTLHDVRWGDDYQGRFVWVFEISGAVPPEHLAGGYAGAVSERQPPMYFPLGGGTIKGVSKPGWAIWSRIYVLDGKMQADLGVLEVAELPQQETERRWQATTPQWPILHAVLPGIDRNKMMGRHKSNHIQVAYVPDQSQISYALGAKIHAFRNLGIDVFLCGAGHEL